MADTAELPDLSKYLSLANQALARLLPHLPKDEGPAGGFFCLSDFEGQPLLVFLVGEPPVHKLKGRFERAIEKCFRAALTKQHSSRATRNEDRDRWAGTFLGPEIMGLYGGFSGLPEDHDEIFVADVLVRAGDLQSDVAVGYLRPNKSFQAIKHLFDWAK